MKHVMPALCALLLLSACSSTPPSNDIKTTQAVSGLEHLPMGAEGRKLRQLTLSDDELRDLQYALNARGLYLTAAQNLAFIDGQRCMVNVSAQGGHPAFTEHYLKGIQMAALGAFDGLSLEIMLSDDGSWLAHEHDKQSAVSPFTLSQSLQTWTQNFYYGQQLHLSIHGKADETQLQALLTLLHSHLPYASFGLSATNFDTLKTLRKLDPSIYLAYVLAPHASSIAAAKQTENREWPHNAMLSAQRIVEALGENSGLHVDIRQHVLSPSLYMRAKDAGLSKFVTYSINGSAFHQAQLSHLKAHNYPLPDEVVIAQTKFAVCHALHPEQSAITQHYLPSTAYGLAIMSLPPDADFVHLNAQFKLFNEERYLNRLGVIQALPQHTDHAFTTE